MDPIKFDALRKFLLDASGLCLQPDKMYLVESRLGPVAETHACKDVDELVDRLKTRPTEILKTDVVEAMTTNETSFFRDVHPFESFKTVVLPELIKARATRRKIRILCAAASSGQEPYSLAMTIRESAPELKSWGVEIVGIDIDKKILERSRGGAYSKFEVQRGLPVSHLLKYFDKEGDNAWRIKQDLKSLVRFEQVNLLKSIRHLGSFDVIFCRNVLIYFEQQTKTDVLGRLSELLADDGTLFLGGAETVLGVSNAFAPRPGHRGLYAPKSKIISAVAA